MKSRINLIAVMVVALISILTTFASANEWDKNVINFIIGTTLAASETVSDIVRIPQSAKIDKIYITDQAGVAKDATDTAIVTMYLNGSAYGNITSADAALVANTPLLLTPTAVNLVAGDIIQFRLTKGGSGKATAGMGVSVSYFNTTSR